MDRDAWSTTERSFSTVARLAKAEPTLAAIARVFVCFLFFRHNRRFPRNEMCAGANHWRERLERRITPASCAASVAIMGTDRYRRRHDKQRQPVSRARRAAVHQLLQRSYAAWRQPDAACRSASAMAAASHRFVNLDELMEAAGRRLAELTGAEWGIVTCGSAAAVALGTAACVAGNDPLKMLRLPFTEGMVNRVIIPSGNVSPMTKRCG